MVFSKSSIWQLQRQYFEEAAVNAWRHGDVPHYVTSNPHMAETYAELLLAFFRDRTKLNASDEPIYIVELGTGSGRFSYHLLKAFIRHCEVSIFDIPNFVYVMTDFVEETLNFWDRHPSLQSYFEQGILDIALFDAEKDSNLYLRKAGKTLESGSLSQPLVAIGNYFFDSIPQELFYIDKGNVKDVFVELSGTNGEETRSAKETLENLEVTYTYEAAGKNPFDDIVQNQILETYRAELENSHLLFPYIGLRCISRLHALSREGLLLITADKGEHRLEIWQNRQEPLIAKHGSFSLTANYHAIKEHCERMGGKALFPIHYDVLNVGCLLYVDNPGQYRETLHTSTRIVSDFGPEDYYTIQQNIKSQIPELSVRDMFAYLRLSCYDSHMFAQFMPRFFQLANEFTSAERYVFPQIAAKVWESFYTLGEDKDLAFELRLLLIELELLEA